VVLFNYTLEVLENLRAVGIVLGPDLKLMERTLILEKELHLFPILKIN